jgi:Protein of unknown function (DUF3305)
MPEMSFVMSVVMLRTATQNKWVPHQWSVHTVVPADAAARPSASGAQVVIDQDGVRQLIYPALVATVHKDEAEGYYLNVSAPEPCVFVSWYLDEASADAVPQRLTLSYNEAARWMDAQEKVDRVALPLEIERALSQWVAANYQPPIKKNRVRPQSFGSKDGRYDGRIKGGKE